MCFLWFRSGTGAGTEAETGVVVGIGTVNCQKSEREPS